MENSKSLEVEVSDRNFQEEVLKSTIPVLVDFWAPWCMPCRMLAPTIEKLAEENRGKLKVCKLNTDENQKMAAQYGIQGIPTLIVFKEGKEVGRTVGVMLSLIHISEPTRLGMISYAVFCLKK